MKSEYKLNLEEHYILQNIISFLPHYVLLWVAAIVLAITAHVFMPFQPDPSLTKTLSVSTTTLSITTITFALPTCMRTIFAAYETYHSTTIRTILINRFPITLLSLSSFTSLTISLLVVSGLVGTYIEVAPWIVFTFDLFWAFICVIYLFFAIEKLVHFVVKAPGAVLDKLEFNIYEVQSLNNEKEYAEFRQNLSSMSDVAATIIRNSTGKDKLILDYLRRLREIHHVYALNTINDCGDARIRRLHQKACYACSKELTKLYREAVKNENGELSRAILKSYSLTVCDCVEIGCTRNYLTELISQIQRFQAYSHISIVPEIIEQASITWFFIMINDLKNLDEVKVDRLEFVKHCMVRELLTTLRRATLNHDEELLITFVRTASNLDIETDLDLRSKEWLSLLDRTVLLYVNWILRAKPDNAKECLSLLRRYSTMQVGVMRPLFCDTQERFKELLKLERFSNALSSKSTDFQKKETETAALMDLPLDIDTSRFVSYLVFLTYLPTTADSLYDEEKRFRKLWDTAHKKIQDTDEYQEFLELASYATKNPDDFDKIFPSFDNEK